MMLDGIFLTEENFKSIHEMAVKKLIDFAE